MNKIQIIKTQNGIDLSMGDLKASIGNIEKITFAHLGCKLRKVPKKVSATQQLADTLSKAIDMEGLTGTDLWDTMRKGSDYWRPGKLLSDVAAHLEKKALTVSYYREDSLCPPKDLLAEFRQSVDGSYSMTFGEYAEKYATFLRNDGGQLEASAAVIMAIARKRLAAFYCVDPYIPDYGKAEDFLSKVHVPYNSRNWQADMREEGCHRVILAEEVGRYFLQIGMPVRVLEIDHTRNWVGIRARQA